MIVILFEILLGRVKIIILPVSLFQKLEYSIRVYRTHVK